MKAIRVEKFGGPEVLQLVEVPDPQPGPGEVLVRLHAAGVNPFEAYIRTGQYPRLPALPYTPGQDGAGFIEAVGEGVALELGARVYVSGSVTGSYAELSVSKAADVHPLPGPLEFAQGAALGVPYATAYRALFHRARAKPGETVLIHGATGGAGLGAVQLAVARGFTVLATGGSEPGRVLLRQQGAREVFDHHAMGYMERVLEFTGGHGVDVIVEMLANVNLANDLKILAPKGRVAVIGSRGRVEIDPRELMGREGDVRGVTLFGATPEELQETHAAIGQGLKDGSLKPVIGQTFPLEKAAAAHEAIMAGNGAHGKVVLTT